MVRVLKCIRAALLVREEQKGLSFMLEISFPSVIGLLSSPNQILLMVGIQRYSRLCTCFLTTRKRFHLHGFPHNYDQFQFRGISVQMSSVATRSSHVCLWCCDAGHREIKDDCRNRKAFFISFQFLSSIYYNDCASKQESNITMLKAQG